MSAPAAWTASSSLADFAATRVGPVLTAGVLVAAFVGAALVVFWPDAEQRRRRRDRRRRSSVRLPSSVRTPEAAHRARPPTTATPPRAGPHQVLLTPGVASPGPRPQASGRRGGGHPHTHGPPRPTPRPRARHRAVDDTPPTTRIQR